MRKIIFGLIMCFALSSNAQESSALKKVDSVGWYKSSNVLLVNNELPAPHDSDGFYAFIYELPSWQKSTEPLAINIYGDVPRGGVKVCGMWNVEQNGFGNFWVLLETPSRVGWYYYPSHYTWSYHYIALSRQGSDKIKSDAPCRIDSVTVGRNIPLQKNRIFLPHIGSVEITGARKVVK